MLDWAIVPLDTEYGTHCPVADTKDVPAVSYNSFQLYVSVCTRVAEVFCYQHLYCCFNIIIVMKNPSRKVWFQLEWTNSMAVLGKILYGASEVLKIVAPPIILFLLLLSDTYSTIMGLKLGLAEANKVYDHFNENGVRGVDIFLRYVLAIFGLSIFLLAEIGIRADKKRFAFWGLILMILWIVTLMEAIVVYSNLLQVLLLLDPPAIP